MLLTASGISGYAIAAADGHLGSVRDFLFDDKNWRIRWLVIDTGHWLPGREVLVPPSALGHPDREKRSFPVRLTMKQIEESPDILADRPVSRQDETNLYDHYGWRPYWDDGFFLGGYGYTGEVQLGSRPGGFTRRDRELANTRLSDGDPHPRSMTAVTGCDIHATDGDIGHVEDFLLNEVDWSVHFLVAGTTNWWPGKKVLISPGAVSAINWPDRQVTLNVDRQRIKDSPGYDPEAIVDRAGERLLHDHYSL